jgi:hypothetical protein
LRSISAIASSSEATSRSPTCGVIQQRSIAAVRHAFICGAEAGRCPIDSAGHRGR